MPEARLETEVSDFSDIPVESDTPRLSESKERVIRAVAVVAVVYATYWILWRWTSTINTAPAAIIPSIILILAETWAYLGMLMFVFLVWRLKWRDPGPPPAGRTVDIFITCYDEPLEVLRRTAIGSRSVRYPHRTYMLDDGKRDDVKAMAEQLEIGYIRRVGNEHAKSGNLNFAISQTSGEFILQLDADHVPLPHIIDRMLGYFRDPQMAVVQSPQDFYNVDSFTHVVNDEGRRLWEENRIFFSLIQPGRDYRGASFFCGSCGILRRSALEEVGGFASKTIIEDMETTIVLQTKGYKSAYHNETLAYGLAPGAAIAYHVQRLRWGQGSMQVLRKLKPLTLRGLTLEQRISYFAGTATYFEGWQKFVFYMMPLFYFYTGILPVGVDESEFLIRLVPYITLAILAFELLSRGTGYLLLSERFTMTRVYTYMKAALAIFSNRKLSFAVTPKGHLGAPFWTYSPQLFLLILSVGAPIWATVAHAKGWIDYQAEGWGSMAFWLNGLWAAWNSYFAYHVVRHSLAMQQAREDHRFAEQLSIQVRSETNEGTSIVHALTSDLNPSGLGFRSVERVPPKAKVSIQLPLMGGQVWTVGEVVHVAEEETRLGRVHSHGVKFSELPMDVRDAIETHCTQHAMPMWRMKYRQSIDIMTRTAEVIRNLRRDKRGLVGLPARIFVVDQDGVNSVELPTRLILEELSERGARLLSDAPIAPGTAITFDVPGAKVAGGGVVRHVQTLRTASTVIFSLGLELNTAAIPKKRFGKNRTSGRVDSPQGPPASMPESVESNNAHSSRKH